ncbi:MAG: hypothetical protein HC927_02540 [Deltaproteobacteria bacterium]|nr:hypothetical protein [Deltaproteobacteria bacterium]
MSDKRRISMLVVLGAGVLLALTVVVSQTRDGDGSTAATASSDDVRGRQQGDDHGWDIRPRPVDPAAQLEFDDREPREWESLGSEGRMERTEAQLELLADEIAASDSSEEQARLRDRALTVLSWARADYFATPSDRARYEAHEQAFESP